MFRRVLLIALAVAACAPATRDPAPDGGLRLPAAICTAGTRWGKGTQVFRDSTAAWGLDTLKVEGGRITAADVDGDGWADLMVRRGGGRSDDFAPGGVRHSWLLHNDAKGHFEDRTQASGLATPRLPANAARGRPYEVVLFADVDNDGDADAFSGLSTVDQTIALGETTELLLGGAGGTFTLGAATSPVRRAGIVEVPTSAAFTDFDRDGNLDLWVTEHNLPNGTMQQDRLYRGDGAGGFLEATGEAGLTTLDWTDVTAMNEGRAHARAWAGAACDLNGDSLPELLTASYGRAPNHLWQARREGGRIVYGNRSVDSGYAYDDDFSWKDNYFARCFCMKNETEPGCEGVLPASGCSQENWNHATDRQRFRQGGNSGSTVCSDLDNDGDIDLVTSEIKHSWAGAGSDGAELLINSGEADVRFTRPGGAATGVVVPHPDESVTASHPDKTCALRNSTDWNEGIITANVLDFDNDGWPDVLLAGTDYPGNKALLYHQDEKLKFSLVPITEGLDHHRALGVVVADFDRDGDLDLVIGHSRARCDKCGPDDCYATTQVRFFENVLGDGGNWLQLDLEGAAGTNRDAIGARVSVSANGVTQTQEIGGGFGHTGAQNDKVLHFGLGTACEADVVVRWPNGRETAEIVHLPAGHRFRLREGSAPQAVER